MGVNRIVVSGRVSGPVAIGGRLDGCRRSTRASFSLAVGGEGDVRCVIYGSRAQDYARRLSEGVRVTVDGRLRQSARGREEGLPRPLEIAVDSLEFHTRRSRGAGKGKETRNEG